MDSRVILNRVRRSRPIQMPELNQLHHARPTLTAGSEVRHREPVSLIIPTFFNAGLKNRSLRRVLAGLGESEVVREVILVSSDGTEPNFDDLLPLPDGRTLKVVRADPARRGSSRNVGAAAASHEHLVFLDDDMLLKSWRCVDVTLSRMIEGDFDCTLFPRRQYAKFPLLYDEPALDALIARWREDGELCPSLHLDPAAHQTHDLPLLFCFPGCFMVIRREAFDRIGGFDTTFHGWGLEDTEFGVRALRRLRVMNLLRDAEPLLHIDHAVSPYKSAEAQENLDRFLSGEEPVDVVRFCHEVLRGENFTWAEKSGFAKARCQEPFEALVGADIPIGDSDLTGWIARVGEARARRMLNPQPDFIVLHGSRATGHARPDSDYDVLALYTGAVQEFFVSPATPRVEIECAELDIFSAISEQPWQFGLSGVLELAKVANARRLWGDAERWARWQTQTLGDAAMNGQLYWRVLWIGLKAHGDKYGALLPRFLGSLRVVLTAGGLRDVAGELVELDGGAFRRQTAALLDEAAPDWRVLLAAGKKVFPLQTPEVWSALYELQEASPPASCVNGAKIPALTR
jgi:hypothetical protein